ncbi:SLAM family member 5-like [Aulostomus maculatus]
MVLLLLLLGVALCEMEASSCPTIIYKKLGDTVELHSCSPSEGVISAKWKHGNEPLANLHQSATEPLQFKGRVQMNPQNFSLTVRNLKPEDSGVYSFVSGDEKSQRNTVFVTLKVLEPIASKPFLHVNTTWHSMTGSCAVFLDCRAANNVNVTHKWRVRNQTFIGSTLQYNTQPKAGVTKFTCTISNNISETSASETVTCSNTSSLPQLHSETTAFILSGAVGAGLFLTVLVCALVVYRCKRKPAGNLADDLTVYDDVSDVEVRDVKKPRAMSCQKYETVGHVNLPKAETVYDTIRLSHMTRGGTTLYQEVSEREPKQEPDTSV